MRFINLFAGSGAFTYALQKYGHTCVFANDFVEASKNIYTENFGDEHFVLGDITDIKVESIPAHDILCAGFPCQPFSIAGKQDGFQDPRSNTFYSIIAILKHRRPRFILLENVKNLLSHDDKTTFKIISESLKEVGYHIKFKILDAAKITGIPHHRERIYIFGSRSEEDLDKVSLDFKSKKLNPIKNYIEDDVRSKYYYTEKLKVFNLVKESVVKSIDENYVYQYRRVYVRESNGKTCPTLTANMGAGGHNVPLLLDDVGIRKLTPRECFNLQGFPKEYKLIGSDSSLYKIAGNAVSIPIIELIASQLNI